jgi:hypothetical protein
MTNEKSFIRAVPFTEAEIKELPQTTDTRPVLLFAGIENPQYSSKFMVKGFEKAGYRVVFFDWQKLRATPTNFDDEKTENQTNFIQGLLGAAAIKEQPDLIFLHIENKDILSKLFCASLQSIAPTIIYTFDCREASENEWLYELVPCVEFVAFSNDIDVANCNELGYENVGVIKSSADFDFYDKLPKEELPAEYVPEIVFIGNRYDNSNMNFPLAKNRVELVDFLTLEYGHRFAAYGMGFSGELVNKYREREIYSAAKIAITHNQFYRPNYASDRGLRAMACECFTIHCYYPGINKDYTPHVASTWANFYGLKLEIDKHLLQEDLRHAKAVSGSYHVRQKHSWYERVIQLQNLIKLSKNKKINK